MSSITPQSILSPEIPDFRYVHTFIVHFIYVKRKDLKPISHKGFNKFIKGKGFKGRNNYKLNDLKAKFGFKPMYNRRTLIISSEDMEPAKSDSMRKAVKAIGVGEGVIRYARNNRRDFFKNKNANMFFIKWC